LEWWWAWGMTGMFCDSFCLSASCHIHVVSN
jgi:hypothetical protein